MKINGNTRSNKAFTLLELSLVLLIIASVMGGVIMVFNRNLDQQQVNETNFKIAAIQKALLDYRRAFNRIPCPADVTQNIDATTNNYYGVEDTTSGTCANGSAPAANYNVTAATFTGTTTNASAVITSVSSTTGLAVGTIVSGSGIVAGSSIASIDSSTQITLNTVATASGSISITRRTVAGGMVPVKTLQLPDDYAIDGWGHRIMYMVDVNLTTASGFTNVPVTDTATNRILIGSASFTGNTTSGSAVVSGITSTSGLLVGSSILGADLQSDSTISSIDNANQITLSKTAITTTAGSTLVVGKSAAGVYLLLSYGKNAHGAFSRAGGTTRLSNYISADPDELLNCHCTSSGTDSTFTSSFVQKPVSVGTFDDIVAYATRADMRSSSE